MFRLRGHLGHTGSTHPPLPGLGLFGVWVPCKLRKLGDFRTAPYLAVSDRWGGVRFVGAHIITRALLFGG